MSKKRAKASPPPFSQEMMSAMTRELPAMLAKEGYLKKSNQRNQVTAPVITPVPKRIQPIHQIEPEIRAAIRTLPEPVPRGNRKALWYSVAFFGVLIMAVWFFNIRALMGGVLQTESSADLVNRGKNDLSTILETIKQNDKIAQDRLRAADAAAMARATTSTEPSSSTKSNLILNNLAEAIKAEQNQ